MRPAYIILTVLVFVIAGLLLLLFFLNSARDREIVEVSIEEPPMTIMRAYREGISVQCLTQDVEDRIKEAYVKGGAIRLQYHEGRGAPFYPSLLIKDLTKWEWKRGEDFGVGAVYSLSRLEVEDNILNALTQHAEDAVFFNDHCEVSEIDLAMFELPWGVNFQEDGASGTYIPSPFPTSVPEAVPDYNDNFLEKVAF